MSKVIEVTSELFDPFQGGTTRDLSIDQYEMKPFYPVRGKNISNDKNNTIKIVTRGLNQHLHLSEGYLDIVYQISREENYLKMANQVDEFEIITGYNDTLETKDGILGLLDVITLDPGTYTWANLVIELNAKIDAAPNSTGANFSFTRTTDGRVVITLAAAGNRIFLHSGIATTLGFNATVTWAGIYVAMVNGASVTGSLNPTTHYIIETGVNDTIQSREGAGNLVKVTLDAGNYSWATLLSEIRTKSAAVVDAADIPAHIIIQPVVGESKVQIIWTTNNAQVLLSDGLAASLGFAPFYGVAAQKPAGQTLDAKLLIGLPIMHDNIMSLFRRISLYFNNVQVHNIDYPVFSNTIKNLQELSQDYVDKRKDQWLYASEDNISSNTTSLKQARTSGEKYVRVHIPLRRIFPFLESYDKVIRGIEIRVELDKNLNNSEMLYCLGADTGYVNIVEAAMWVPEVVGSAAVEAKLLEDVIAKENTVIAYEDHQVYRQLNPAQSSINWVLDTISEVPLFIFVGMQHSAQLDGILDNISNPSIYKNLNLIRAECRINNKTFPKMPYQLSFANNTNNVVDEYTRLYFEFLRTSYKDGEFDNGSLVEYTNQFKNVYPIVTFNLSREEDIQANLTENNSLEIFVQFADVPKIGVNPIDVYLTALVVYQSKIVLQTDGKSYEFIRV